MSQPIRAYCFKKYIENNKIVGYHLVVDKNLLLETGDLHFIEANTLKNLIKQNTLYVENLTFTKNNKLVSKGKQPEKRIYTELELKQYIGKMNLLGRVKTLTTRCGPICYLVEKSKNNYLLYIPDDVEVLNYIDIVFTEQIQNLEGMLEVIGGKNLVNASSMFAKCRFKYIDLSQFITNNIVNMQNMFYDCSVQALDLSNFNVEKVQEMSGMFSLCDAEYINLSSFNTKALTYTTCMFKGCKASILDLRNINTSKVINMRGMFDSCISEKIIFDNFHTENVTTMYEMFRNCTAPYLDLRSFNTKKVTVMSGMFFGCESKKIDLSSFSMPKTNEFQSMFEDCTTPELDLRNFGINNKLNYNTQKIFKNCKTQKFKFTKGSYLLHILKKYSDIDSNSIIIEEV